MSLLGITGFPFELESLCLATPGQSGLPPRHLRAPGARPARGTPQNPRGSLPGAFKLHINLTAILTQRFLDFLYLPSQLGILLRTLGVQ